MRLTSRLLSCLHHSEMNLINQNILNRLIAVFTVGITKIYGKISGFKFNFMHLNATEHTEAHWNWLLHCNQDSSSSSRLHTNLFVFCAILTTYKKKLPIVTSFQITVISMNPVKFNFPVIFLGKQIKSVFDYKLSFKHKMLHWRAYCWL